jgi:hypothetical protein
MHLPRLAIFGAAAVIGLAGCAPPKEELNGPFALGIGHSCNETGGSAVAEQYAHECAMVTDLNPSPCNVKNSCDALMDASRNGCVKIHASLAKYPNLPDQIHKAIANQPDWADLYKKKIVLSEPDFCQRYLSKP